MRRDAPEWTLLRIEGSDDASIPTPILAPGPLRFRAHLSPSVSSDAGFALVIAATATLIISSVFTTVSVDMNLGYLSALFSYRDRTFADGSLIGGGIGTIVGVVLLPIGLALRRHARSKLEIVSSGLRLRF